MGGVRFPPGPSSDVHWGHGKTCIGGGGNEARMESHMVHYCSIGFAAALQTIAVSNHRSFFVHKYFVAQLHAWLQCLRSPERVSDPKALQSHVYSHV